MKKKDTTSSLAKLQSYGYAKDPFDDSSVIPVGAEISSIAVRCGEVIDNIQVNYSNDVSTLGHGGTGGQLEIFSLDSDEYITEVSGIYGTWWNAGVIKQLTIVTTKQQKTFGTDIYPHASTSFSIRSSKEYPITGFYGSTTHIQQGTYVTQIGAIISTSDVPAFYKAQRNTMISSLYDPAFMSLKEKIGWSSADETANETFKQLKSAITTQQGYYGNPYEARYFNCVIEDIRNTTLYGFLKGLPKGAILHLHPSSMGDYCDLLQEAAQYSGDTCQVRFLYKDASKKIIDPVNTDSKSFQWLSSPNTDTSHDPNLGAYMDLKDALNDQSLKQAATDLLVLSPDVMDYEGDMWNLFQPVFSRGGTLFKYPEIETAYYQNAFKFLVDEDNLLHVELRSSWDVKNEQISGKSENIILNAAKDAGISLKVINFNSRHFDESTSVSTSVLQNVVNTGNAILNKESDYLCGYDLVGEEDSGATTEFLINDFYVAYYQLNKFLPPFFFHDGESDLPVDYDPNDNNNLSDPHTVYFNNNLVDAYLLNTMNFDGFQMTTNRVGHGLELFKTPKLSIDYKSANLAVELCPISNQLLRYIKDLREHPGQSYLAGGMPVSLSPDDPAIYGYQGVTFDFWEAAIAWGLDLKMVKVLCYYSLQSSSLSELDKANTIQQWRDNWDTYIQSFNENGVQSA